MRVVEALSLSSASLAYAGCAPCDSLLAPTKPAEMQAASAAAFATAAAESVGGETGEDVSVETLHAASSLGDFILSSVFEIQHCVSTLPSAHSSVQQVRRHEMETSHYQARWFLLNSVLKSPRRSDCPCTHIFPLRLSTSLDS